MYGTDYDYSSGERILIVVRILILQRAHLYIVFEEYASPFFFLVTVVKKKRKQKTEEKKQEKARLSGIKSLMHHFLTKFGGRQEETGESGCRCLC